MASNAQKTPLARSLNLFAEKKVYDFIQLTGKALPCKVTAVSGSIVTVSFQVGGPWTLPTVTVPMFGPEYIRYPTQVGDTGVVFPADASLGGITGLGGTAPVLPALSGNLSALVFFPVASKNWSASEDPNALVLYGPDGGILRTTDKTSSVTTSANGTKIKVPAGKTVNISSLPLAPGASGDLWNSGGQVMVVP
jgi:hypothetical protein